MGQSSQLRLGDVRKVFRLLGEIREFGADPLVWRRHMLESLGGIVGMQVGMSGETLVRTGPVVLPESLVEVGGPGARDVAVFKRFLVSSEPARCPVFRSITHWRPGTHTRNYSNGWIEPPFDRHAWCTSTAIERHRAAGLDGCVYSQHALPGSNTVHVILANRGPGEKAFTDGQSRLLHIFHEELARLWQPPRNDALAGLPPRLRQTLDGLLRGQAEKQVAGALGLSCHTVHNYVKDLHRRLGVTSRAELLARCAIEPRFHLVPRLSFPLRPAAEPARK